MKILITDDSKMSQMVVHKFVKELFSNDLEVKFAFTGEEALEIFDSFNPNICTVDIIMSGIDGIETTKRIYQKSKTTKVIIITSTDEKVENFKDIPIIKAVVNKPITLEKMKKAINQL